MMRRSWTLVGALSACLAFSCSSGKNRPSATLGDASSGSGGAGAGGAGTTDGGHVKPSDTTPPQFDGIGTVTDAGNGNVTVSWTAATDAVTPAASLSYVIYRSAVVGAEDFKTTRRCGAPMPDAGAIEQADAPCVVVAPAGATSAIVGDVIPGRANYFVVRAVDQAGNEDANKKEIAFTADDKTSPDFGGVRSVTALSPASIGVDWGAGYDLGTPDSSLKFAVYLNTGTSPDPTTEQPVLTTKPGVHSAIVTNLLPQTTYAVLVRAVDGGGNEDANVRVLKAITPEGIPPAFNGARRGDAEGTTVRLFWTPATDNVTEQANVVYDVYLALVSHKQNFTNPSYSSDPGASSITIQNLEPGTAYYFVVRARDAAGNRDSNIVQIQINTDLADRTPPIFTGVTNVSGDSPGTLVVTWPTAQDDTSSQKQISYELFVSSSTQLPLSATATPTTTVTGTTSARITGLAPGTRKYVVVRAMDAAGNVETTNDVEVPGQTLPAVVAGDGGVNTTPPSLTSAVTVKQVVNPASRLTVSWSAATDPNYGSTNIRYHVCASTIPADCQGSSFGNHVIATTNWGTTTATLNLLATRTTYDVYVRAEDRAGNLETDDHSATVKTATSWSINVKPVLFTRCIACHDTYDEPTAIVGVGSSFIEDQACVGAATSNTGDSGACLVLLIDPGRPEYSYIYRKVNPLNLATAPFSPTVPNNYNGLLMPRDTTGALNADDDDIIRTWIEQGANAN